jgi:beta-glucanase (GH16 family)
MTMNHNEKARKLLIMICMLAPLMQSQVFWQFNKDSLITWQYLEGDEFNGSRINTGYWKYCGGLRSIYGNKEQQYYTNGENVSVKDGLVTLEARRENITGRVIDWMNDNDSIFDDGRYNGPNKRSFNFTSGQIETDGNQQYGYFEIKFSMTATGGFWPAFWLAGGDPNEEIDMMELKTEKPDRIHVGRHSTKREENYLRKGFTKRAWGDWVQFRGDLTKGYNVVAGEWTSKYIKYFLNGEVIAYTEVNLPLPKKMIINLAVPSNGSFKPGPEDEVNSGDYKVDYVRVWTRSDKKRLAPQDTIIENALISRDISRSSLLSMGKFLYGRKELHSKQGIQVSFMRLYRSHYQLRVLGREIPRSATFEICDVKGKILLSGPLQYGERNFDLESHRQNGPLVLKVKAYDKEGIYPISR